ncbi:MAG: HIT domain-containing protein [Candidatus Margulisbacteria bacterium]|nr:HIT domain-containing protein [Candidatus Margulisiibacteriota bacterium]
MIREVDTAYFSGRVEQRLGVKHHLVLDLKGGIEIPKGPGGHLRSREAVAELREELLPDFSAQAGIQELTERGLRMSVDIARNSSPVIQLIAGPDVAAQSPQDWLSPSVVWNPNAPALFFERCAEAAADGADKMAFGNKMLYADKQREFFGVVDGDLKAETHFLVLARAAFGNILDHGFTADHLNRFFETAFQICKQLGILDQQIRFIANTGTGFQVGPRVHMHVLSSRESLPSMFPVDYGFSVVAGGTIVSPEGSAIHDEVIALIGKRQQIKGFTEQAKTERKAIDSLLFKKVAGLYVRSE